MGGGTKSFLSMINALKDLNYEITILCPDNYGIYQYLMSIGYETYFIPYRPVSYRLDKSITDYLKFVPRYFYAQLKNKKIKKEVSLLVKKIKPDIVHENTSVTNIGFYIAKSFNIPYFVHIREYGYKDFKLIIPDLKHRLKQPFTYSIPITKDIALYKNIIDNSRSVQLYDGIINISDIRYSGSKEKFLLYAGRVEEGKGIMDLIFAYIKYVKKVVNPIKLVVAGKCTDSGLLHKINSLTKQNHVDDKVSLVGEISYLPELYYRTVATIIPSKFEGLGRILPEALANGSLCICKNTGGTKEQLDLGYKTTGNEIAIRYDTNEELATILTNLTNEINSGNIFQNESQYYNIIHNGQISVRENFSIEKFGQKLSSLYQNVYNNFHKCK